jgi:hypothetical protein
VRLRAATPTLGGGSRHPRRPSSYRTRFDDRIFVCPRAPKPTADRGDCEKQRNSHEPKRDCGRVDAHRPSPPCRGSARLRRCYSALRARITRACNLRQQPVEPRQRELHGVSFCDGQGDFPQLSVFCWSVCRASYTARLIELLGGNGRNHRHHCQLSWLGASVSTIRSSGPRA